MNATDKVFDRIAAHRAAAEKYNRCVTSMSKFSDESAGYAKALVELKAASFDEHNAYVALLLVKPLSTRGISAMARYVSDVEFQPYMKDEPEPAIQALRTIACAAACTIRA